MIQERATVIPQCQHTSVEDEYKPTYENTLPGITNIAIPIAKSTPVTQVSHIPMTKTNLDRDIVRPMSSERARTSHLENQIKDMSSVHLPLNTLSMEEESHASTDLTRRINTFCKE